MSFDSDEMRDDWIKAIIAAKENKPVPDSVNRAFVLKSETDDNEDNKDYFNKLLTAFASRVKTDSFQDVILCLSSFFNRAAVSVRIVNMIFTCRAL